MNLRKFLQEKLQSKFTSIWAQLLQYRARTGSFANVFIWEDAQLVDPLTWWRCHGGNASELQKLAINILNIPTSSAASERCWSAMGNIHDAGRNRLTDERAEKLLFIYFNERIFNKL